jgi:tetratricopeptide (TPR) repeat protein
MTGSTNRRRELAIGGLLAALTIAAYARVAGNGFINLDDNDYVTENLRVQAGLSWKGAAWAFTTGHSANWHPLTWLSHMLDCQLFGMNPAGPHLTNLALHVASVLLLFHLFRRMTAAVGPSAFVAAAFALHPVHVESVAWVAERKDVLSALLWILTTLVYVRWVERPGAGRWAWVVALYTLGLLAKPMLVTLPFVLLLLDVWPLSRLESPWRDRVRLARLVREKSALFALAAASCAVTFLVQRGAGAMSLGDQIPFALRAQNALMAYVAYLGKTVVPARLAVFYPHRVEAFPALQVAGAALLLLAATVLALRTARERPWFAVGWLWFLGTLVPVIGLVQVGSQAMADRYMYVPMIGLSAAVGFGAAEIVQRSRVARPAIAGLFALAVAGWTGLTWRQVGLWKDDQSLFRHVVEVMPENYLAHGILGNVHLRGNRFEEAMAEYREALRLRPSYAQAHSNLGMAFELQGRPADATAEYRTALLWSPDLPEAHHNLGRLLAEQGSTDQAIGHYEAALRANPDLVEAHVNLGVALTKVGRIDEAIAHLERALELKPGFAAALQSLGAARAIRGSTAPR